MNPTAYHEAGHAVASWLFDFPIKRVSIIAEDDHLGAVYGPAAFIKFAETSDESGEVEKKLKNAIVIYLAGGEAQRRFDKDSLETWHDEYDQENAFEVIRHFGYPTAMMEIFYRESLTEATRLVAEHWGQIKTVATALLEEREMTGERVVQLLSAHAETLDIV